MRVGGLNLHTVKVFYSRLFPPFLFSLFIDAFRRFLAFVGELCRKPLQLLLSLFFGLEVTLEPLDPKIWDSSRRRILFIVSMK